MEMSVIEKASLDFKVDIASIQAVMMVESSGKGFNPDGSLASLLEGHIFYKYTNGKYCESNSSICYKKWSRSFYGKTWKKEKDRFEEAFLLDKRAALLSCSWGLFQIMGFNHKECGYSSPESFIEKLKQGEAYHLEAFMSYLEARKIKNYLQNKNWSAFAKAYNGPGYKKNEYDKKLKNEYLKAVMRLNGNSPKIT